MINTIEDIKNFVNDNSFKKIYVLCGKKSFITSGAQIFFNELLDKKDIKLFYKNSDLPILEELIEIIRDIKNFKPVEPYKAKGIKERGQFVLRKEGKKK